MNENVRLKEGNKYLLYVDTNLLEGLLLRLLLFSHFYFYFFAAKFKPCQFVWLSVSCS